MSDSFIELMIANLKGERKRVFESCIIPAFENLTLFDNGAKSLGITLLKTLFKSKTEVMVEYAKSLHTVLQSDYGFEVYTNWNLPDLLITYLIAKMYNPKVNDPNIQLVKLPKDFASFSITKKLDVATAFCSKDTKEKLINSTVQILKDFISERIKVLAYKNELPRFNDLVTTNFSGSLGTSTEYKALTLFNTIKNQVKHENQSDFESPYSLVTYLEYAYLNLRDFSLGQIASVLTESLIVNAKNLKEVPAFRLYCNILMCTPTLNSKFSKIIAEGGINAIYIITQSNPELLNMAEDKLTDATMFDALSNLDSKVLYNSEYDIEDYCEYTSVLQYDLSRMFINGFNPNVNVVNEYVAMAVWNYYENSRSPDIKRVPNILTYLLDPTYSNADSQYNDALSISTFLVNNLCEYLNFATDDETTLNDARKFLNVIINNTIKVYETTGLTKEYLKEQLKDLSSFEVITTIITVLSLTLDYDMNEIPDNLLCNIQTKPKEKVKPHKEEDSMGEGRNGSSRELEPQKLGKGEVYNLLANFEQELSLKAFIALRRLMFEAGVITELQWKYVITIFKQIKKHGLSSLEESDRTFILSRLNKFLGD